MINAIQEAQKSMRKDLETTFGCKQLQIAMIDKEVQKVAKKMAQTIEFTERLMKYSSSTEILIFKVLFLLPLHVPANIFTL
jgi:pheromone shutdown protein TraB